jgi:hypothetical protein
VSKGQGPDGQRKASINPAAAASLSAANWQGKAKALEAFGTIGRSDGPFLYGANGAGPDSRLCRNTCTLTCINCGLSTINKQMPKSKKMRPKRRSSDRGRLRKLWSVWVLRENEEVYHAVV